MAVLKVEICIVVANGPRCAADADVRRNGQQWAVPPVDGGQMRRAHHHPADVLCQLLLVHSCAQAYCF